MMSTTEYATKPWQYNLPMVQGVLQGPIIAAHLQCTNGEEASLARQQLPATCSVPWLYSTQEA